MAQLSVGFAMSGSFCTFDRVLEQMKALVQAGMEAVSYTHLDVYKRQGLYRGGG